MFEKIDWSKPLFIKPQDFKLRTIPLYAKAPPTPSCVMCEMGHEPVLAPPRRAIRVRDGDKISVLEISQALFDKIEAAMNCKIKPSSEFVIEFNKMEEIINTKE